MDSVNKGKTGNKIIFFENKPLFISIGYKKYWDISDIHILMSNKLKNYKNLPIIYLGVNLLLLFNITIQKEFLSSHNLFHFLQFYQN